MSIETTDNKKRRRNKNETKKSSVVPSRYYPQYDTSYLVSYLESLELHVKPEVHVNGHLHPTALVTVDLGSPLTPIKLATEVIEEITERLRALARDVYGRDANVRISYDGYSGIYWASVA